MSAMAHLEKDFKTISLCLTGRVITMYSNSDGLAVARYIFDDEMKAVRSSGNLSGYMQGVRFTKGGR